MGFSSYAVASLQINYKEKGGQAMSLEIVLSVLVVFFLVSAVLIKKLEAHERKRN
jgi:hypothetical protein